MGRRLVLAALLAVLAAAAAAQAPPVAPAFAAVSIKPLPACSHPMFGPNWQGPIHPGGEYVDPCAYLESLIGTAYHDEIPDEIRDVTLVGLPDWGRGGSGTVFEIDAKAGEGFPSMPARENAEAVGKMLRTLLADRFKLVCHTETRPLPVFDLEVEKTGVKLKPAAPNEERSGSSNGQRTTFRGMTLGELGGSLSIWLQRPVIDKTGLTGHYDGDVAWDAAPGEPMTLDNLKAAILRTVPEMGLRLVSATGPVTVLVVDHVEPPSSN